MDIKKIILSVLWILLFNNSCTRFTKETASINLNTWEFKMVSRGNNVPLFDPIADSIHYIPILLNDGYTESTIQKKFNWNKKDFKEKVDILLQNGFLKRKNGALTPSLMIVSEEDAKTIKMNLEPLSLKIAEEILRLKDSIERKTMAIPCFRSFEFEEISLLILSNVLLDNGQLQNIENDYLNKERPNRNGRKYYASYQEKSNSEYEALGIYGNQVEMHEGFALCRYGNQRYIPEVLAANDSILELYKTSDPKTTFNYPILTAECNIEILEIANFFKPYLLQILKENDQEFIKHSFRESQYIEAVTYEEYFMWIYHILYSEVTEILLKKGVIQLPIEKVSFYVFQP